MTDIRKESTSNIHKRK